MFSVQEDLVFRNELFLWLDRESPDRPGFTRSDLAAVPVQGSPDRIAGTMTGIWKVTGKSDAAVSIITAYVPPGGQRPYEDGVGSDGLQRYKWRGDDPNHADNVSLRRAMEKKLPLVWFVGIGYVPGTQTQMFQPIYPVFLVAEEKASQQFVVAVEPNQKKVGSEAGAEVVEIARRYNRQMVKVRYHQPVFRSTVMLAYETRCAVCRLPFGKLLDAAHIRSDADGGAATVTNGLALCKIHHGAFDANIIGIDPEYRIHVRDEVLQTFDGPTLQHSIKEMNGETLRQLPARKAEQPDRALLAERFETFRQAS